ncbi:MAG: hypothetical protein KatS3mg111_0014 [Pirellulaceae bacterium]|nr:MAG: hypothetical protein KatS3mg111_0014 [Pirellulaceae bacterium]
MRYEEQHLQELISAHIDGQLSEDGERELEALVANDPLVGERIDRLKQQRQLLQRAFQQALEDRQRDRQVASGAFTERILAEIARRHASPVDLEASTAGSPPCHVGDREQKVGATSRIRSDGWNEWRLAMAAVGIAAIILVALGLTLRGLLESHETVAPLAGRGSSATIDRPAPELATQNRPLPRETSPSPDASIALAEVSAEESSPTVTEEATPATPLPTLRPSTPNGDSAARYVSELDFSQSFVFVVDVEVSEDALQNNLLQQLLQQAGIEVKESIRSTPSVLAALAETRMIVAPPSPAAAASHSADDSAAEIYFIRADLGQIGPVLDRIYFDRQHFPQVSFDLAIDSPSTNLLRTIARQTGDRFAVTERFAAPLTVPEDSGQSSLRLPKPARYVSSARRSTGFSSSQMQALVRGDDLSNVLLIVRAAQTSSIAADND